MKTKKGFTLRPLGNEYILIAEGVETVDFNQMISLNESAALLWENVDGKDFDTDTLINLLIEHYGISHEQAAKDIQPLIQSWKKAGIIED